MKVRPVVVVSPWAWLLITFWKPIVVFMVVLSVLLAAMFPAGAPDGARQRCTTGRGTADAVHPRHLAGVADVGSRLDAKAAAMIATLAHVATLQWLALVAALVAVIVVLLLAWPRPQSGPDVLSCASSTAPRRSQRSSCRCTDTGVINFAGLSNL